MHIIMRIEREGERGEKKIFVGFYDTVIHFKMTTCFCFLTKKIAKRPPKNPLDCTKVN